MKNYLIALFEINLSPPKWIFNAAKKCNHTSPLLLPELNLLYSSEGEMTSLDRTKLGTSPVGTIVSSLIAGNLPNAKKIHQIFAKYFCVRFIF